MSSNCRSLKLAWRSKPQSCVSKVTARTRPAGAPLAAGPTASARPAGRPAILSADSSALRSSANGWITTPWVDASARNSTKSCVLRKPRAGPSAGDDQQRVADLGIGQPVQLARIVERDGDAGAPGADDVASDAERLARLVHAVAEVTTQAGAVRGEAGEPRPLELAAARPAHRPRASPSRCGWCGSARCRAPRRRAWPGCRTPATACRRAGTPRPASAPTNGNCTRRLSPCRRISATTGRVGSRGGASGSGWPAAPRSAESRAARHRSPAHCRRRMAAHSPAFRQAALAGCDRRHWASAAGAVALAASCRGRHGFRRFDVRPAARRALRLCESPRRGLVDRRDVDDVVEVLAEGAQVDLLRKCKAHRRGIGRGRGIDRLDRRRQSRASLRRDRTPAALRTTA